MLRLFKVAVAGQDRKDRFESKAEARKFRDALIKDGKKGAYISRAEDHRHGPSRRPNNG